MLGNGHCVMLVIAMENRCFPDSKATFSVDNSIARKYKTSTNCNEDGTCRKRLKS
jgi:hypothetical protein